MRDMRHFREIVNVHSSDLNLSPFKLDIGSPITPALGNINHINFDFSIYALLFSNWNGNTDDQTRCMIVVACLTFC